MLFQLLCLREGDADYEAFRAALEALFDTFASGGQLIQPNETVAYVGIPAAPQDEAFPELKGRPYQKK